MRENITPSTIAIFENRYGPYYDDNGKLNRTDLIESLKRVSDRKTPYSCSPYTYFALTGNIQEKQARTLIRAWWKNVLNTNTDKNWHIKHIAQENLAQLHALDILYYTNVEWLIQDQHEHTSLPNHLFLLGAYAYTIQGKMHGRSYENYIPAYDYHQVPASEAFRFGLEYPLDYTALMDGLQTSKYDNGIDQFLIFAHAASMLSQSNNVEGLHHIMDQILPLLRSRNLPVDPFLDGLYTYTNGRSLHVHFYNHVQTWIESVNTACTPLIQEGAQQAQIWLDAQQKKAMNTPRWSSIHIDWIDPLLKLSETDPLYESSRTKIADALVSAYLPNYKKISFEQMLLKACDAGVKTMQHVLHAVQHKQKPLEELFSLEMVHADHEKLAEIKKVLQHPVFQTVVPEETLQKVPLTDIQRLTPIVYAGWKRVTSSNPQDRKGTPPSISKHIVDAIEKITTFHTLRNTEKTLKDAMDPRVYNQYWAILGIMLVIATNTMPYNKDNIWSGVARDDFLANSTRASTTLPRAIEAMMLLDPAWMATQRHQIRTIMQSHRNEDAENVLAIYRDWMDHLFGPGYKDPGLHELFIKDASSCIAFLAKSYEQQSLNHAVQTPFALDASELVSISNPN